MKSGQPLLPSFAWVFGGVSRGFQARGEPRSICSCYNYLMEIFANLGWISLALLSAFFAALVAVFAKLGLGGVDSTLATALRSAVMFGFMILVVLGLGSHRYLNQINQRAMILILLSGIAGTISWIFYFMALKRGPIGGVVGIDRLSVVFAVILAIIFLGDKLTLKEFIGAILVSIGAILLSLH